MKKSLSLVIALVLCLCAVTALADVVPFESFGATIDIPAGMKLLEGEEIDPEIAQATGAFALILDEANQAYVIFTYTENEEITAIDLGAMSPEEISALAASIMAPHEVKQAMVGEVAAEAWLAITFLDEAGAEQNMMMQFGDGGFVAITFKMADESQMPEEIGTGLLTVVASLAFVAAE